MKDKQPNSGFFSFNMSDYEFEKPVFEEKNGKPYITYGKDNLYPARLIEFYNDSAKHNTIINGMSKYVAGKGLTVDTEGTTVEQQAAASAWIATANRWGESWNELTEKIAIDLEIYNGCYLEIIFNKLTGQPVDYYHVDFDKVRTNKAGTEFYISEDWSKSQAKWETVKGFNPNIKSEKQLYFLRSYRPGTPVYPLPEYIGALRYIELDIEIANFHLSAIHNGMMLSKMINLNNGIPGTDEEQAAVEKNFKKKYAGSKNSGKFMLSFNNSAETAPTVIDLSGSELDKQFELLNKQAQQEIFTGHGVTSPMLFGIKTEGQLGGRAELREAYELLKNTKINARQQQIERCIKVLSNQAGITAEITIIPTEPIATELSEAALLQILDKNELREMIGVAAVEVPQSTENSKVLDALNSLSPLVATKVLNSMTDNEVRTLVGLPNTEDGDKVSPPAQFSAQEDEDALSVFAEFGEHKNQYISVKSKRVAFSSDLDCISDENKAYTDYFAGGLTVTVANIGAELLGLIQQNPKISAPEMAQALEVSLDLVENGLKDLVKQGALTQNDGGSYTPTGKGGGIIDDNEPKSLDVFIRYSYAGPQDAKNRPFCAKLKELDRVYSRKDIEAISAKLGYSVWMRRGGFYTNPKTGLTTPYCRHHWQQELMIRKPNQN